MDGLDFRKVQIGTNLTAKERDRLLVLIKEYHYIFSRSDNDIGQYTGNMSYKIELMNPIIDTYPKQKFNKPEHNFT